MTILPQRQYRDPLEALIKAEEETCKGCRWRTVDTTFHVAMCRNMLSGSLTAAKRCDHYEEPA